MDVARPAAREAARNLVAPLEHRIPGTHAEPICPTADPGRLFTRVSHAVRQAMALEARIAAGDWQPRPHTPPNPNPPAAPPPRTGAPPRPTFRAEPAERLDDEFLWDRRSIPEILTAIRQALGLAPDVSPGNPALLPARPGKPSLRGPPPRPG